MSTDPWGAAPPADPTPIQVSGAYVYVMNLGDHGERARQPIVVDPAETVESLVRRVFDKIDRPYSAHDPVDVIELQAVVLPEEPKP